MLTPTLAALLAAVEAFREEWQVPPSRRELCERLGITSTASVHALVEALQADGLVRHVPRMARSLVVTDAGRAALRAYRAEQQTGEGAP